MHRKWISPEPSQTAKSHISSSEDYECEIQSDSRAVLKTIFEQLDKPSPDKRPKESRIIQKSISLGQRLGRF